MVVQPVDTLLKPGPHVVHILSVLRHLVPALVVANDSFGNQCVYFINAVRDKVVVQRHAFLGQFKPTLGKIAAKRIRIEQVFPKTRPRVVLVVELPHIVATSVAKSVVSES